MIIRSCRRHVALFAILAILFGQLAMTAYACPVQGIAPPVATTHGFAHEGAGGSPCSGLDPAPVPASGQANACEVHCTDGIAVAAQPDLPPIALTALPATAMTLAELCTANDAAHASIAPVSGAPPAALQFCRLLI